MQQTLVMIKPDGVERALVGEIIRRIEQKGFRLAALKMLQLDRATAESHYAEHSARPFLRTWWILLPLDRWWPGYGKAKVSSRPYA